MFYIVKKVLKEDRADFNLHTQFKVCVCVCRRSWCEMRCLFLESGWINSCKRPRVYDFTDNTWSYIYDRPLSWCDFVYVYLKIKIFKLEIKALGSLQFVCTPRPKIAHWDMLSQTGYGHKVPFGIIIKDLVFRVWIDSRAQPALFMINSLHFLQTTVILFFILHFAQTKYSLIIRWRTWRKTVFIHQHPARASGINKICAAYPIDNWVKTRGEKSNNIDFLCESTDLFVCGYFCKQWS